MAVAGLDDATVRLTEKIPGADGQSCVQSYVLISAHRHHPCYPPMPCIG
jgi:hypothetical protein